jgi:hypothetical protein
MNNYSVEKEWQKLCAKRTDLQNFFSDKQRWYAGDATDYEYSLKLITDDGIEYQQSAFWCGYFESLVSAEVVQNLPKIKL